MSGVSALCINLYALMVENRSYLNLGGDFLEPEMKKRVIVAITGLCVLSLLFGILFAWQKEKSEKKTKIIETTELQDPEKVQKNLIVRPESAREITREIYHIQSGGGKEPAVTYYISAPDIKAAANKTAAAIEKKSDALPKAVTEKSDRTVISPDPERQKVDVYKIDLAKTHKIKVGAMTAGGKAYVGAGYQAGRWTGMLYTRSGKKIEAGSISYTVAEW